MAVARPPVSDKQTWAVDVIPIDLAFKPDFHSRVRTRIPMEKPSTQITQIYAAQISVVAVLQTEEVRDGETQQATTTVVFDATTGKALFDPLEGQAEVLGAARELLLTEQRKPPSRVVKTRDGSALAPWGELPAADAPPVFRVSPGKEALALDLERGEIAWDLDPDGAANVKSVDFEGGNAILNVQLYDGATTSFPWIGNTWSGSRSGSSRGS